MNVCQQVIFECSIGANYGYRSEIRKENSDLKSLINSIRNINEVVIYFQSENKKSEGQYRNYRKITTILKSFDTFVNIATTPTFLTIFFTGIGLIVIPKSTGVSCGLANTNKILYENLIQKYDKQKTHYQRAQQTLYSFDNF